MDKRHIPTVLISILLMIGVSGCASSSHETELKNINLDDVAFAIPLHEASDAPASLNRSQMVFVSRSGNYQVHDGTAMFSLEPAWTSRGLLYADSSNDYFVGRNSVHTKTVANRKTDFQYASIAYGDNARLTIYNSGMQDKLDGQIEVAKTDGSYSTRNYSTRGTGAAVSLAECNGEVYGISGDDPDYTRLRLMKFTQHGKATFRELKGLHIFKDAFSGEVLKTIGGAPTISAFPTGSTLLPCSGGVLHFITSISKSQTEASKEVLVYGTWDISTGKTTYVPLRNEKGALLTNEYGDYGGEWSGYDYDQQSFDGVTHTFVSSETGRLMQTDVETGITRVLDAPKITGGAPYNGRIYLRSSKTRFYVFMLPMNDDGGIHSTVRIYDRHTSKLIKIFTIDDQFTQHLQNDSVQNGPPVINPAEPLFKE